MQLDQIDVVFICLLRWATFPGVPPDCQTETMLTCSNVPLKMTNYNLFSSANQPIWFSSSLCYHYQAWEINKGNGLANNETVRISNIGFNIGWGAHQESASLFVSLNTARKISHAPVRTEGEVKCLDPFWAEDRLVENWRTCAQQWSQPLTRVEKGWTFCGAKPKNPDNGISAYLWPRELRGL